MRDPVTFAAGTMVVTRGKLTARFLGSTFEVFGTYSGITSGKVTQHLFSERAFTALLPSARPNVDFLSHVLRPRRKAARGLPGPALPEETEAGARTSLEVTKQMEFFRKTMWPPDINSFKKHIILLLWKMGNQ